MPISNINWNALERFNMAAEYAQQAKDHPDGGGGSLRWM